MRVYLSSVHHKSAIVQVGDGSYRISLGPPVDFDANYNSSRIRIRDESKGRQVLFDPELFVGEPFELNGKLMQIDSVSLFGDLIYLRTLPADSIIEGVRPGNTLPSYVRSLLDVRITNIKPGPDGEGYLLIDFWGSWCGPCIESIPYLAKLFETFGSLPGFNMLSIAWEHNRKGAQTQARLVSDHGMDWHQLVEIKGETDAAESLTKLLKVESFPTTFLIDGTGKIVFRRSGLDGVEAVSEHLKRVF